VDSEIVACNQWLRREIELVTPRLLVALGATAARALLGRTTPIGINRGRIREYTSNMALLITVHPSFLLRVPEENKDEEYEEFEADIRLAKSYLRPT
jgi:uracil-DNA glycosylase